MKTKQTQTTRSRKPSQPLSPRYCYSKPRKKSLAPVVVALAAKAGVNLLKWQRRDLEPIGAVDEHLQFVHRRVAMSIPRQAGKTTIIEWYALVLAMLLGARILWTAHNYPIIVKTVEDFRAIIGAKAKDTTKGIPWFNLSLIHISEPTRRS